MILRDTLLYENVPRSRRKRVETEEGQQHGPSKQTHPKPESDTLGSSNAPPPIYTADPTPELTTYGPDIKLGWIQGVLIPCLLNIWGVMLFLRIAWIVAQAGIGLTIAIIFLSGVVCVTTTLSLSAICTNGVVKGGGVYYLVSRSLGAELGASVGIIFAFANAVAASMNTIGFCESLNELLKSHGLKIIDNSVNDVRIVGAVALFLMCVICAIGMDWETKAQNFLIAIILIAITNYIVGSCLGPRSDEAWAKGFVGINSEIAATNWEPDFRYAEGRQHNFMSVFAMYFPAVTGVQAGANICGDLKEPAVAIPKGTLIALALSTASYLIMAALCGVAALRDASGNTTDLSVAALSACKPNCPYGLHNNYEIMHLMAAWGPLIYGGCWAATLSTALTNILSVPRLIQALGTDEIYPGLIFFSKPFGRHGEPYRGYVLIYIVSLLFLLIADLNTIAPLITNFYLASYSLINFCSFHAEFIDHISWRPSFRYHNKWVSLLGFVLCIVMMVIIGWLMAILTLMIFLILYLIVLYRKPTVNWGSSTDAQRYTQTVSYLVERRQQRVSTSKSYNPQLLVLAGPPHTHPVLVDVAHLLTKTGSFMLAAYIEQVALTREDRKLIQHIADEWFTAHKFRGFYTILDDCTMEQGTRLLIQTAGLGPLKPNILLVGFMVSWTTRSQEDLLHYIRVLQLGFDNQLAVLVLRTENSSWPQKRHSTVILPKSSGTGTDRWTHNQVLGVMNADSNEDIQNRLRTSKEIAAAVADAAAADSLPRPQELHPLMHHIEKQSPSLHPGAHKATIYLPMDFGDNDALDVWWLYDDGGLIILLSYIMAERHFRQRMNVRIYFSGKSYHTPEEAKQKMEALLVSFRVQYSSLTILQGLSDPPSDSSWNFFNTIIQSFKTKTKSDILITDEELNEQKAKTSRHLRVRELLLENSKDAAFIMLSLPMPRKGQVSAALYMAWLDVLSRDLPPTLFVRGSDTPVLAT